MICDFHLHSNFSGDSHEDPEKIIKTCIELGMSDMCFTDHQDFDFKYEKDLFTLDYNKYFEELRTLKDKYKDKINVHIGVELGIEERTAKDCIAFAKNMPYEFIIASTHLVDGIDPYYPEYFGEYSEDEGFKRYFEFLNKGIDHFDNFDVYGHLDYVIRYAPNKDKFYNYCNYIDIIDEILKKLIHKGKGIEVNTAGLYKGLKQTNPSKQILKRYKELGGEIITVGSDAHVYTNLGYAFDTISDLLKESGFDYYCIFENRKPKFLKLD